ncbi:restriction endonuclease subunit S [Bifidobacterium longum]
MTEQAKVPAIRFAGFTDPWEQRKFGDCFEFLKSNTLSRAGLNGENGTARNVHYGDILIKFGDCLDGERSDLPFITDDTVLPKFAGSILREGDVIFADTAEDEAAGKCVELRKLPKEPTISGLHTIPARPRFFFGTGYLGHYLNSDAYHRQLLPLMQGIKVISVSKAALQDTQVRFPGLSEQAAIGAALSEIDNLITLHQRKYDKLVIFKKSMLEKMFPKDGESVPEIRFAGFTDPWEQRKLEDIANRVTRKNEGESDLPLTISSQYGLVDQRTFFNNQVASKDMSGYYLLRKGEFAYNKSTSGDSPWGAVKRLVRYEKGCVSTLYICFGLDGADPDFLVTYYETDRWYKAVQMIAAEGARNHGLLNIAPNDFFDTALILPPSREEQELIGLFFARLDNLITLHQRKLELLQNIKKSLLDKMFV